MFYPPSLPLEVLGRSFRASNGELGLMPQDAVTFLDACERDGVRLLGWEFWIADHQPNKGRLERVSSPGFWYGGIPLQGNGLENIIQGNGDVGEIRRDLPNIYKYLEEVEPEWAPYIRINFTLE